MGKKLKGKNCLKVIVPPVVEVEFRFVVPAGYKDGVLAALDDIRALFGKNGQNWITDDEHIMLKAGDHHPGTGEALTKAFDGYCLIGGVHKVDGQYEELAQAAIGLAILDYQGQLDERLDDEYDGNKLVDTILDDNTIINFNDSNAADWDAIKAVLKLAKKMVRQAPVA